MTDPPPVASNARTPCLQVRNMPVRLTSTVRRHTVSSSSSTGASCPKSWMPALATRTSRPPQRRAASSTAAAICSSSDTSATAALQRAPDAPSSAPARSRRFWSTSTSVTAAPASAQARAIASPIPEPAPVTRARLPSKSPLTALCASATVAPRKLPFHRPGTRQRRPLASQAAPMWRPPRTGPTAYRNRHAVNLQARRGGVAAARGAADTLTARVGPRATAPVPGRTRRNHAG